MKMCLRRSSNWAAEGVIHGATGAEAVLSSPCAVDNPFSKQAMRTTRGLRAPCRRKQRARKETGKETARLWFS